MLPNISESHIQDMLARVEIEMRLYIWSSGAIRSYTANDFSGVL